MSALGMKQIDPDFRYQFGAALTRHECRSCGGSINTVFADLGSQPPANFYLVSEEQIPGERSYPLRAVVCADCKLVQVQTDVPPEELFFDYAYFSSFSDSWLNHAKAYARSAVQRFGLDRSSFVIEVASNDGYLLKNFVDLGIPCLGIEPAETVAAAAQRIGVPTEVVFLDRDVGAAIASRHGKADLVIANNVWAHVPDLNSFTAGIAALLKEDGILSIELQHLLPFIRMVEFDTIYHEHYTYMSLLAAERLLARHGLKVIDVEQLSTHGGSLRYFITHAHRTDVKVGSGLLKVREEEAAAGLDDLSTYSKFAEHLPPCRDALRAFVNEAKASGKTVAGYGAAAKGNTLLNFCELGPGDIPIVADRNPHKQGKLLPGTHIPIVSPGELIEFRPDYVLILPWNLKDEVMDEMKQVSSWGGKFLVAIPTTRIIG